MISILLIIIIKLGLVKKNAGEFNVYNCGGDGPELVAKFGP